MLIALTIMSSWRSRRGTAPGFESFADETHRLHDKEHEQRRRKVKSSSGDVCRRVKMNETLVSSMHYSEIVFVVHSL